MRLGDAMAAHEKPAKMNHSSTLWHICSIVADVFPDYPCHASVVLRSQYLPAGHPPCGARFFDYA